MSRNPRRRPVPPVVAVAAAAALGAGACGGDDAVPEPVLRPVRTITVVATGGARTRTFAGTAEASVESRLSFKVAGTIASLSVRLGDRVAAGDPIAALDPTDYELQLEDARAALRRAEAEERKAAADLERIRRLYENGNAAQADLDAARAAANATRAAEQSAAKNLELARQRLGYTRLAVPLDGAISDVRVEVGENVNVGQVVAVLSSGERPDVQVSVPEALVGAIREGDVATCTFDALPGREFPARVTEIGVAASRATATYPVTVSLTGATADVRPGMAAQVALRFAVGEGRTRIVVPAFAVLEDPEGRHAFVVEEKAPGIGVVRRRPVEIGELGPDGLEIRSGLADGDRVVTAGVSKLRDGLEVRLGDGGDR